MEMLSLSRLVNRVLSATFPEGNEMSRRLITIAPACHFGATVMVRTLFTASPFGGGGGQG